MNWWQYLIELILICGFLLIIMKLADFTANKLKKLHYFDGYFISREEQEILDSIDRMSKVLDNKSTRRFKDTSRFKYASSGLTKKNYYRN